MIGRIFLFSFLLYFVFSCSGKKETDQKITVYCAASLAPVIQEIKESWEQKNSSRILINAASSGLLARQIENGAPADLFISANDAWTQYLIDKSDLKSPVVTIASNRLVIVTTKSFSIDTLVIDELPRLINDKSNRLVIADPAHVPLGKYTQESLEFFQVYDENMENYIVAKDARNALRILELGEASAGILYYSDAIASDHLKVLSVLPESSHQKIEYSAVALDANNTLADDFLRYIIGEVNQHLWKEYGFSK